MFTGAAGYDISHDRDGGWEIGDATIYRSGRADRLGAEIAPAECGITPQQLWL